MKPVRPETTIKLNGRKNTNSELMIDILNEFSEIYIWPYRNSISDSIDKPIIISSHDIEKAIYESALISLPGGSIEAPLKRFPVIFRKENKFI